MRRSSVVAIAALMAAVALTGLPAPAGSTPRSTPRALQAATLTSVSIPASASAPAAAGPVANTQGGRDALREVVLIEPGRAPSAPGRRPRVEQPDPSAA